VINQNAEHSIAELKFWWRVWVSWHC